MKGGQETVSPGSQWNKSNYHLDKGIMLQLTPLAVGVTTEQIEQQKLRFTSLASALKAMRTTNL